MKIVKPGDGPIPPDSSFVAFQWKTHDVYRRIEIARIHKKVECRMLVNSENPAPLIDTKSLLKDSVFQGAEWNLEMQNFMLPPFDESGVFVVWYFKMKED